MAATNRLKVYDEFEDTYVPTHNVECNQQSSGLYRVMVYSGFYIASNGIHVGQYKSFLVLSENPARKGLVFVEGSETPTGVVNLCPRRDKEYRIPRLTGASGEESRQRCLCG